jgi:aldehyde dehydrogenase (NAD+)
LNRFEKMPAMSIDAQAVRMKQLQFFQSGKTLSREFRQGQLGKLEAAVKAREEAICDALFADLHKNKTEAYVCEVSFLIDEIKHAKKNLAKWMKAKRVKPSALTFPSKSVIHPEPLGSVLIIGPWNYPFQLVTAPLVAAIAAGNCAVLKPSELAPATSRVVGELIRETFAPEFVAVTEGGVEVSTALLEQRWDHIFFTGGTEVGRIVYTAAAKNLVPVTLELGGKSPCIVDDSADLDVTARRIAWGKFINAGQTCVAPDYLLVPKAISKSLVEKISASLIEFFGEDPAKSPDYGRIISDRHFDRLVKLMQDGKPLVGGVSDKKGRYIAPTLITPTSHEIPLMREEIFGPILPVIEYGGFDEAVEFVRKRPKPLALYHFSKDKSKTDRTMSELSFGGGCFNDTLVHLASPQLPFGGVGDSGIGAYHGKHGFDIFSHHKSVVSRAFWPDPKLRYPPYEGKLKILRYLVG